MERSKICVASVSGALPILRNISSAAIKPQNELTNNLHKKFVILKLPIVNTDSVNLSPEISDDKQLVIIEPEKTEPTNELLPKKSKLSKEKTKVPSEICRDNLTGELPICKLCLQVFKTHRGLSRHMISHNARIPYICKICHKRCRKRYELQLHMYTHTGERPFACKLCDLRFKRGCTLAEHMLTHTQEKKFMCDFCGKKFLHSCSKTTHMRVHTGEKPYSCRYCDMMFSALSSRKKHELTHAALPMNCPVCNRVFYYKRTLDEHLSTVHVPRTGSIPEVVKPFSCKDCGKFFKLKKYLRLHQNLFANGECNVMKTKKVNKEWVCESCGTMFKVRKYLMRHVKRGCKMMKNEEDCEETQEDEEIIEDEEIKEEEDEIFEETEFKEEAECPQDQFVCNGCGLEFSDCSVAMQHMYSCPADKEV